MTIFRTTTFSLILFLLISCASTPHEVGFNVSGLVFKNMGAHPLYQPKLLVQSTRRFISCSNIIAGGTCSTSFPARRYQDQLLTITWSTSVRNFSVENIIISKNQDVSANQPVTVNVDLGVDGALGIFLKEGT